MEKVLCSFSVKEKDMVIERTIYSDKVMNALVAVGCTVEGASGAAGNLFAESKMNPRNLEDLCEKKLGYKYTDDTYTEAVDSGKITRALFLHPLGDSRQYGYGFCQWTSAGRKAGLYDLVKSRKVSIGDPDVQIEYMIQELKKNYQNVWKVLQSAKTVQEASDIFLVKFESPSDVGSSVKKLRASYGEAYLKIYKNMKEEKTMSLISNCGHDENGKYTGGKPGDQTGTEWALIDWYARPWTCVLRHPDPQVRAILADLATKAAKNNLIGYCQGHRLTYWKHLKASNYDPSQITVACEADCSSGVSANIRAAAILLKNTKLQKIPLSCTTRNLREQCSAHEFQVLTDKKYLENPDHLFAGDLLLCEGHHVATNVWTGSKASGSNASTGTGTSTSGTTSGNSKATNVKKGQRWLNVNYGDKLVAYCGAKLKEDGDFGTASRWAALAIWKDLVNRKFGAKLTPTNKNFGTSCKAQAGKAGVHSGTTGTFTYLCQFLLAAKGYYTGPMDAVCGDGTVAAIAAFQRATGKTVDGWCGADTWYGLFN